MKKVVLALVVLLIGFASAQADINYEAEDLSLSGYEISTDCLCSNPSGGECARRTNAGEQGSGSLTLNSFDGETGEYEVSVKYCDEDDEDSGVEGPDNYGFFVEGVEAESWTSTNGGTLGWVTKTFTTNINSLDTIRLDVSTGFWTTGRVDKITFKPLNGETDGSSGGSEDNSTTNVTENPNSDGESGDDSGGDSGSDNGASSTTGSSGSGTGSSSATGTGSTGAGSTSTSSSGGSSTGNVENSENESDSESFLSNPWTWIIVLIIILIIIIIIWYVIKRRKDHKEGEGVVGEVNKEIRIEENKGGKLGNDV